MATSPWFERPGGVGAAWIFEHDGAAWSETAILLPPTDDPPERFGGTSDIAFANGRAIVVADDPRPRVYVFERSLAGWVETARLVVPGTGRSSIASIATDGEVIAIGRRDGSGSVAVFEQLAGDWTLTRHVRSPRPADGFGGAVALDGRTLLIGANGLSARGAFIYTID